MKKVNLLLAAVVAASVAAPSFAANIETSGYFRMTANQGKGGQMTKWQVNNVGRLGNEADDYGEFIARAEIAKVNDTTWTFQGQWQLFGDSDQNVNDKSFLNNEAFLSVTGLFDWDKDAELWAGRRYLRQYVAIADWYYSNYSGHGAGINNLQVGPGKLSVFWSRTTKPSDYQWNKDNKDVYVKDSEFINNENGSKLTTYKKLGSHIDYFNADYTFGLWDGAELLVKDTYGVVSRVSGDVHSKNELGNNNRFNVELHVGGADYWNSTGVEWFHGAISGVESGGGAWVDVDENAKSAHGYRLINQGYYKFNSSFGLEHVVSYGYAGGFKDDHHETLAKAVVRPTLKLTKMTKLVAELGAFRKASKDSEGDQSATNGQKYTLAYCITPDTNNLLWGPSIKFFVSYIHGDNDGHKNDKGVKDLGMTAFNDAYQDEKHNTMFGVQAEGSW